MPAIADYNSLYYDLKCINVFRQGKLTNQQFKELVSKIEVRPYMQDEIITELHEETQAALYLVVSGGVWLERDKTAPVKLPSGCNFGEELLQAAEGVPSSMVPSPYTVKGADDACVCAVLTMESCREVFDIDNAEKQKDASTNMTLSPAFSTSSSKEKVMDSSKVKVKKKKKAKDDDDRSVASNKSSKSTKSKSKKVKKEKKDKKERRSLTKSPKAAEAAEELAKEQIELEAAPNLDASVDKLDLETAEKEPIKDPEPEKPSTPEKLEVGDHSEVSLGDGILEGSKSPLNDGNNSGSINSFSRGDHGSHSSLKFPRTTADAKKTEEAPSSVSDVRRRWSKHLPTSPKPAAPSVTEDEKEDKVGELKVKKPSFEAGKYRGPVRARRGSVAERFLNRVSGIADTDAEAKPEVKPAIVEEPEVEESAGKEPELKEPELDSKDLVTEEDLKADTQMMLEGSHANLVGIDSDDEGENKSVERSATPPPAPIEKQISPKADAPDSPVKSARSMFENQIKKNDVLKKQASWRGSLHGDGSSHGALDDSSHSTGQSPARRRFTSPVLRKVDLEVPEESESESNHDELTTRPAATPLPAPQPIPEEETFHEELEEPIVETPPVVETPPSPPPPPITDSPPKKKKSSTPDSPKKPKKKKDKEKKKKSKKDGESKKKSKHVDRPERISPRRKKEKSSFIARLAKFEDNNTKPVTRSAGNVYQAPTTLPEDFEAPSFPKTEEEAELLKTALKKRFVFETLPDSTIQGLTDALEKSDVKKGTMLFNQGERDGYFYVVGNGEVEFQIDGEKSGVAGAGESFGEEALLHNAKRQASVLVTEDAELYKFSQTTFRHLLQDEATKSDEHKRELLEKLDFLESASPEQLMKLSGLMTPIKFKKGEILAKHDDFGKNFFLIADGKVECQDVKLGRISKKDQEVGPGEYFGKQAILEEHPLMKANVVAKTDGRAYMVSNEARKEAMGTTLVPIQSRTLHAVKAFERKRGRQLKHPDIMKISRCIKNVEFSKGETIVEADVDVDAAVYFLRSGRVHELQGRNLLMITEGSHFGEPIFESARKNKSLKGRSPTKIMADKDCVVGVFSIEDYYKIFGDEYEKPKLATPPPSPPASPMSPVKIKDVAEKPKSKAKVEGKSKKSEEEPKKVEEEPKKVEETPKKVEEKPETVEEKPKKVEEKPKKVEEKPKKVEEKPKKVEEKPKKVEEKPKKVEEKPKKVEEKPKKVEEKPETVEETPKKVEEKPKKVEEKPKKVEEKPKKVEEKPKKAEEKPKKAEEKPKKEETKKTKAPQDDDNDVLRSPSKKRKEYDIKLANLERRVCLGEGEFGQVWLVVDKTAKVQVPHVLKVQSKYHLLTEGEVEICKREKDVLLDVNHPFIINMMRTYQDPSFVFMLMDFVQGGELFSLLNDDDGRVKLPEEKAKFYALGIADALAHLHDKKYVYRDLKPENVMIDAYGYPKVIDFGFAKKVLDKTFTLCGTPGYLAPEIVISQGHSWAADHWALGVLTYEMVMGFSPFYYDGIEQFELYRSIVEDDFPKLKDVTDAVSDFLSKLLMKDPTCRLGSLSRGEKDVLSHRWFAGMSTKQMRERKVEAPWKPDIKDPLDTSNFDDWSGVDDKMLDKGPKLREKDEALFEGF